MLIEVLVLTLVSAGVPRIVYTQDQPDARVIAEAVSALPQPLRAGAEVRVFRGGKLMKVRDGTNGMICLADDPSQEGWHVACYHESLEPFMARGRELRSQAVTSRAAIDSVRQAEIESGVLEFPNHPTALYSLFADRVVFDPASGEAEGARGLYVIYMAYATEASTGISAVSSRERPWLMFPGKPWAHVMIPR